MILLLAPEGHMPIADLMHTAAFSREDHDLILAIGDNRQHDLLAVRRPQVVAECILVEKDKEL